MESHHASQLLMQQLWHCWDSHVRTDRKAACLNPESTPLRPHSHVWKTIKIQKIDELWCFCDRAVSVGWEKNISGHCNRAEFVIVKRALN